jgi:hypothetical protein
MELGKTIGCGSSRGVGNKMSRLYECTEFVMFNDFTVGETYTFHETEDSFYTNNDDEGEHSALTKRCFKECFTLVN